MNRKERRDDEVARRKEADRLSRLARRADRSFEETMSKLNAEIQDHGRWEDTLLRSILRTMKPTIVRGLVYCENHGVKGNEVEAQICDSLVIVIFANRVNLPAEWFVWSEEEMRRRLGRYVAPMGLWMR